MGIISNTDPWKSHFINLIDFTCKIVFSREVNEGNEGRAPETLLTPCANNCYVWVKFNCLRFTARTEGSNARDATHFAPFTGNSTPTMMLQRCPGFERRQNVSVTKHQKYGQKIKTVILMSVFVLMTH